MRDLPTDYPEFNTCKICPRSCGVNRNQGKKGSCGLDARLAIASIVVHRGEEPPISGPHGIVNVFFMHCNLQCSYCQNKQISSVHSSTSGHEYTVIEACNQICNLLDAGCGAVGFVSPSQYIPYIKAMVIEIRQRGYKVPFVYNTHGYDLVEQIRDLEGYIDVWLPDFKYAYAELGQTLSRVKNYPQVALAALKEMYRQKGNTLVINENGYVESGIIIRHLVLPGYLSNSIKVLDTIAWELSPGMHLSLMSQYNPQYYKGGDPSLRRTLTIDEYTEVVDKFFELGFYKGWIQALDSYAFYNPDFEQIHPFE